jgi:hypothetical protein
MVFLEYLDPLVFLIALGVGIFIAYVLLPNPTTIYKYPTPDNAGKVTYIDDTGVCYKYRATEVSPNDDNTIQIQTIE